jgi:hypothetical protein
MVFVPRKTSLIWRAPSELFGVFPAAFYLNLCHDLQSDQNFCASADARVDKRPHSERHKDLIREHGKWVEPAREEAALEPAS